MDLTEAELETIQDLNGCFAWTGVEGGLKDALMAALGAPQRLTEAALIPRPTWDAAVATLQVQAQRCQIEWNQSGGSAFYVCASQTIQATPVRKAQRHTLHPRAANAGGSAAGLKLSAILDPTLDADIQGLGTFPQPNQM